MLSFSSVVFSIFFMLKPLILISLTNSSNVSSHHVDMDLHCFHRSLFYDLSILIRCLGRDLLIQLRQYKKTTLTYIEVARAGPEIYIHGPGRKIEISGLFPITTYISSVAPYSNVLCKNWNCKIFYCNKVLCDRFYSNQKCMIIQSRHSLYIVIHFKMEWNDLKTSQAFYIVMHCIIEWRDLMGAI